MAVDLGNYDFNTRRKDIKLKLEKCKENIRRNFEGQGKGQNTRGRSIARQDSVMISITSVAEEVKVLATNVDNFKGPHFIQLYRTLHEKCVQFQLKLDKIGVDGRDDARNERRKLLLEIEAIDKKLGGKVHENGKSCPDCELKNY